MLIDFMRANLFLIGEIWNDYDSNKQRLFFPLLVCVGFGMLGFFYIVNIKYFRYYKTLHSGKYNLFVEWIVDNNFDNDETVTLKTFRVSEDKEYRQWLFKTQMKELCK